MIVITETKTAKWLAMKVWDQNNPKYPPSVHAVQRDITPLFTAWETVDCIPAETSLAWKAV